VTLVSKVVIVTGGSSGIGLALCQRSCMEGALVWMLGRDVDRLQAAQRRIVQDFPEAEKRLTPVSVDVTDGGQVTELFTKINRTAGPIDILINSAGVAHPGYVQELDLAIFHWMMDVNYFGIVNCVKAALPFMLARKEGYIVNIASLAAIFGVFGYTAYAASKFAVRGFSEALRAELKPQGVNVSVVYPPDTDTPQLAYENRFKPSETRALSKFARRLSPEAVASEVIKGMEARRFVILPGVESKLLYWASGILRPLINPMQDLIVSRNANKEER
jgi:3-dehydrosphinganine reductase